MLTLASHQREGGTEGGRGREGGREEERGGRERGNISTIHVAVRGHVSSYRPQLKNLHSLAFPMKVLVWLFFFEKVFSSLTILNDLFC